MFNPALVVELLSRSSNFDVGFVSIAQRARLLRAIRPHATARTRPHIFLKMFTANHKATLSASCQGETVTAELLLFSGMFATLHSRTDILKQSILKKSSSKAYMRTSLRANAGSTWGWTRVCVGRTNLPLDQILNKEPCAESTIITSISNLGLYL